MSSSRVEEFYNGSVPPEVARWGDRAGMAHVEQLSRLAVQGTDKYKLRQLQNNTGGWEWRPIDEVGVQEPVHVDYNVETGRANLAEGNHRLAVAKAAGLDRLPTVVHRVGSPGRYGDVPVREAEDFPRKQDGYVPGQFNPRYIGLDQEDTTNQPTEEEHQPPAGARPARWWQR